MKKINFVITLFLVSVFLTSCQGELELADVSQQNLVYSDLPNNSYYAYPLGNGLLGAQVWKKDNTLRMSLDCSNLWDLRPMKNFEILNFKMVKEHVESNDYGIIQQLGDKPYVDESAPCKILGAALSFDLSQMGAVSDYTLDFPTASCIVNWKKGSRLETFVHATQPVGWFKFTNVPEGFIPEMTPPIYNGAMAVKGGIGSASQSVRSLGYGPGTVQHHENRIVYDQEGWGGYTYQVAVEWYRKGDGIEGVWSISTKFPEDNIWYDKDAPTAGQNIDAALKDGFASSRQSHLAWWTEFWNASSISLPEGIIHERRWYQEQFKYGSSARRGAPAIGLLGVWANDNGLLPEWKGDYHNDVNTQFPYWTAYSGNHLEGEWSLLDWLWNLRPTFRAYTKKYFGVDGLNVPGCCTLDGKPMGGWIQYANGLTVSAWFAHHFYWHWRYSMDREFLKTRAYPWFKEVITYLDNITEKDENGMRKLPLSSSPEYNDNKITAWFKKTSNFDLALIRFVYGRGAELAGELGYMDEQKRWKQIEQEWPDYDLDEKGGMTIAPGQPLQENHRHHSHLQAIFPLDNIAMINGEKDQSIIRNSLKGLEEYGPTVWPHSTGVYYARAWDGENALKCLDRDIKRDYYNDKGVNRLFIRKTDHFYPVVIQEMLLQSHAGYINIFPAVPSQWQNCSFKDLRAEGAFLVSAERKDGKTSKVTICSEKGGKLRVINPFGSSYKNDRAKTNKDNTVWEFDCKPGEVIVL